MSTEPVDGLVDRAAAGDEVAWAEIVERYDRLVWHVVLSHGFHAQDGADIHQTTWLRLAENLRSIRDASKLGSWLATTARRECQRQRAARARELVDEEVAHHHAQRAVEEHDLAAGLLETERDVALWEAFQRLSEPCQQLLRLLLADPPFSYQEISAILDIPVGSIGPTRARCLARLATAPGVIDLEDRS